MPWSRDEAGRDEAGSGVVVIRRRGIGPFSLFAEAHEDRAWSMVRKL